MTLLLFPWSFPAVFWDQIWAHAVCTPRQLLLLLSFLQQNVFVWLQHWTVHILEAYSHVGAKAELIHIDLEKIFWKYPSVLLILPCCFPLSLFFSWQFRNLQPGNLPSSETLIPSPLFFPDTVQIHATVNRFLKVQRLSASPHSR